ncbi:hypothetical protein EV682_101639 [Iodobacter fluviatilis]|uniref:Uncharacterized protein n=1 Tax=Iodobacter fluviatilis TaxID=537 RepID=A0A377Q2X4_9NEIS|nr:hypothetical protein EV682_101639 [Iodobacter fluviatilis]STQ89626.1 Uncharacterised protein [Iodobacter fluviatilis]
MVLFSGEGFASFPRVQGVLLFLSRLLVHIPSSWRLVFQRQAALAIPPSGKSRSFLKSTTFS